MTRNRTKEAEEKVKGSLRRHLVGDPEELHKVGNQLRETIVQVVYKLLGGERRFGCAGASSMQKKGGRR